MNLRTLLDEVKKTNPTMTEKRLIEELKKCTPSAIVLNMICENAKEKRAV